MIGNLRTLVLLALPILAGGCESLPAPAAVGVVAANVASVATFGRAVPDLAVSAVTGRDCSVVRLDRGQSYCAPREHPPEAPPFCSRSIGTVDCWANPDAFANRPHEVADGPRALTPEQEKDRTARWPKALFDF